MYGNTTNKVVVAAEFVSWEARVFLHAGWGSLHPRSEERFDFGASENFRFTTPLVTASNVWFDLLR